MRIKLHSKFLRNSSLFWWCLSVVLVGGISIFPQKANAQLHVQVGTGTANSYFYGPLYRSTATSVFNYGNYAYLYTPAELSNLPSGATITGVAWEATTTSGGLTGNNTFRIDLANTTQTSIPISSNWNTEVTGATTVYNNTSYTFPAGGGWVLHNFTTPFTYLGGNLKIMTDHIMSGTATGVINFFYENKPGLAAGISSSTSTQTTTFTTLYSNNRPNIRIYYTFTPVANDVMLMDATITGSGCNYTSSESLTIRIKNTGIDTVFANSEIPVGYYHNNNPLIRDTITLATSLAPNDTLIYVFPTPVNLSAGGAHDFKLFTAMPNDMQPLNDTFNFSVNNLFHDFNISPYTMGFEPSEPFTGWAIQNANNLPGIWSVIQNSGNQRTGTGVLRYNYDCSGPADDWAFTRCLYLEAGATYQIEFWYRALSASFPEHLKVQIGNQQINTAMGDTIINIPGFTNTTYQLASGVFTVPANGIYYIGFHAYSASCMWDIFVDDLVIERLFDNNPALTNIISPANDKCGEVADLIGVEITNMGGNTLTSIPVVAELSGLTNMTLTDTYIGSISPAGKDTLWFSTAINTIGGGNLNIKAYTDLANDPMRSNDTFTTSVSIVGIPQLPLVQAAGSCNPGMFSLTATSNAPEHLWYSSLTSAMPIHIGDTFNTSYLDTTTSYYVAAGSFQTNILNTTFAGGSGCNFGNMFDAAATSGSIAVEGFTIVPFVTQANHVVRIYYKPGTYVGFVNDSTQWTFVEQFVVNATANTPQVVTLTNPFNIPAGQTYGIYVSHYASYTIANNPGNTFSDNNLTLTMGDGLCTHFTSCCTPRNFNGAVHYSAIGCQSERVEVKVTIHETPQASVQAGPVFQGQFNLGGLGNIDQACAGDTLIYELHPPTGMTNADFGTEWIITSFSFGTSDGTPATDSSLIMPSSSSNAMLTFVPTLAEGDSSYLLSISIINMITGCDTIIQRILNVSPTPEPAFTATDVCLGTNMPFVNTTTMQGSGTMDYSWNFGDNNTSTASNPNHLYAAAGNYVVTLAAQSNQGCTGEVTDTVVVFEMPVADFNIVGNCANESIEFINQSVVHSGPYSYLWNFGNNNTSTSESPMHYYGAQGSYSVRLTVENNGCIDSLTQIVDVLAAPVASFIADNFCQGSLTQFTNTTSFIPGSVTYEWEIEGATVTDENPTHTFNTAGDYIVTLHATQQNGCSDSYIDTVTIMPLPDASYTYSNPMDSMGGIYLFNAAETGHSSYVWNFGDGNTATGESVMNRYDSNGVYNVSLVVNHANGCIDSTVQSINVIRVSISQPVVLKGDFKVYPNPYAGQTTIIYTLLSNADVKLAVFDMSGRMVTSIVDGTQTTGEYNQQFSASTHGFGPGTYIVRLVVDGKTYVNRIVELR